MSRSICGMPWKRILTIGVSLILLGCEGTFKRTSDSGSDSKNEIAIATLAANESRNQVALYILNYTNMPGEGKFTGIGLASGRVLSSSDGRFKFEQNSSAPSKNFYVYFDPNDKLWVVLPQLKRAFYAPAAILQSPEAVSMLAAYDGLRILMGQGSVWSDPSRTQFNPRRMGGATVEQTGSPLKWNILFESGDLQFPIKEMEANAGMKSVLTIDRQAGSFESLDYSGGNPGGIPGQNVRGTQINVNTWRFRFPGSASITEIQLNPLSGNDAKQLLERGALDAPKIPEDFQSEELSVGVLLNWLNIR